MVQKNIFKKITKKDKIYHFNKLPGSEGAKKTTLTILSSELKVASNKKDINKQIDETKK